MAIVACRIYSQQHVILSYFSSTEIVVVTLESCRGIRITWFVALWGTMCGLIWKLRETGLSALLGLVASLALPRFSRGTRSLMSATNHLHFAKHGTARCTKI